MKNRYLKDVISKDLKEKMVFLAGPRQVGKTTFAKLIGEQAFKDFAYFNWDNRKMREAIRSSRWPSNSSLIILDELHKYSKWKSFIKGEYDVNKDKYNFLVTGSARLNVYKKGGDSLLGRYHYYRLHPFSYAELLNLKVNNEPGEELVFSKKHSADKKVLNKLLDYGGFPEPYIKSDKVHLQRWHNDRKDLLFKEDVRDLTSVRDISSMDLMGSILPSKVGSLLSLNSIREDIEVTHKSVSNWLKIFEMLYYSFRVYPYQSRKINSLKKEAKLYLWDWSEVENKGARLENLVASHLLKFCDYLYDAFGHKVELFYLGDVDKRELDFLVTYNSKPWFAVEVKTSQSKPDKQLRYFKDKLKIPYSYQVVYDLDDDYTEDGIRLMSLGKFLSALV